MCNITDYTFLLSHCQVLANLDIFSLAVDLITIFVLTNRTETKNFRHLLSTSTHAVLRRLHSPPLPFLVQADGY